MQVEQVKHRELLNFVNTKVPKFKLPNVEKKLQSIVSKIAARCFGSQEGRLTEGFRPYTSLCGGRFGKEIDSLILKWRI